MKRILPVYLDTGLTTDCFHFMKLAPLFGDERFHPWYMERFIELEMGMRDGESIEDFWLHYYRLEHVDLDLLYQGVYNFHYFTGTDFLDIVSTSIDHIDQGSYVVLICDNYYIRNSEHFRKSHDIHEYLLFGYDKLENMFNILAIKDHKWTTETVSFEDIKQGFVGGLDTMRNEFKELYRLFRYHMPATSFSPKLNDMRKPNLSKMLESIENYLTGEVRQIAKRKGAGERPYGSYVEWSGTCIYEGLRNRICGVVEVEPSLLMDRGIILGIKRMYENKRGMLNRLHYLHNNDYIQLDCSLTDMFQELCESLDKLMSLMMVFYYRPGSEVMASIKKRISETEKLDHTAMTGAFQVIYNGLKRGLHQEVSGSAQQIT
ncbi:hypothetical protein [Paenibacillus oryzisoli]|uniref:Butirosin biosynthesis protein H N-terminal domain-containing protein n=1 Tax=Paenibacillus oryzisoli TaxID=1850517 RepID=A0A198ALP4_9BACL|nr:hypothetical protein [Paenibacillus oryzisoli]OAS21833.1 hypothetical protein A8708_06765 [Paenibacillus oryzisoli]